MPRPEGGRTSSMLKENVGAASGHYDFPGGYAQRFDGISPDLPQMVEVRGWNPKNQEELVGRHAEGSAHSGSYMVTSVTHSAGTPSGERLSAHEAAHVGGGSAPPPPSGGPVPMPYPTSAGAAADAGNSPSGKPLLIIAEDVEGEHLGMKGLRIYFRWTL